MTEPGDSWVAPTVSIPSRGNLLAAIGKIGTGDVAAKAAVLVTTLAAARLLDPADFAVYAGLLAVSLLSAACWDAGIATLVTTEASRQAPTKAILRRVLVARLMTLPVWLGASGLGFLVFRSTTAIDAPTLVVVSACSLAAATSLPLLAVLRGHLQFGRYGMAAAIGRWLTAVLTIGLLAGEPVGDRLPALFLAQVAGEIAILVFAAALVARIPSDTFDRRWDPRKVNLRRSLPFAANSVLAVAYNRLDLLLVATLTSHAQFAAYTPASRLQDAAYILPTALAAIALPYLSRTMVGPGGTEASRAVVKRLLRFGLLLAVPASGLLILGMPAVISGLLGPAYEPSVPAARILSLSMIVAVAGGPILALLIAAGRGPATTKAFVAAFGVSLGLHLSLDWWLGSVGAAIASVARDVVNLLVAAYLARDLLGIGHASRGQDSGVRSEPPEHGGASREARH